MGQIWSELSNFFAKKEDILEDRTFLYPNVSPPSPPLPAKFHIEKKIWNS